MIDNADVCFYFLQEYAQIQQFRKYQMFHSESSLLTVDIQDTRAISLPKSPIGGFFTTEKECLKFKKFLNITKQTLQILGAQSLEVVQPPEYYPHAVSFDWMEQSGFSRKVVDVSHYIPLDGPLINKVHSMERRKLMQKKTFEIHTEPLENLRKIHEFISKCRQQQGLEVNISYEKLKAQCEAFPDRFAMFSAKENEELISAVIVTIPAKGIVYYYLPATDLAHKKKSPMVHLIAKIYDYFQTQGFQHLDLGISSVNGIPQTSLIQFKENMGGVRTERVTYEMSLT